MGVKSFKDLIVYQKAYALAINIFEISKKFPAEEKYSLTDQIRRSSRSVTSCLAESWAKKIYIRAFINKLSDSLGEEYETECWLDYAKDFGYITADQHSNFMAGYDEVRRMLIAMINDPDKWCN